MYSDIFYPFEADCWKNGDVEPCSIQPEKDEIFLNLQEAG